MRRIRNSDKRDATSFSELLKPKPTPKHPVELIFSPSGKLVAFKHHPTEEENQREKTTA